MPRIFTRTSSIVPRPRIHQAPQELTPDPRTAFLCRLTADERAAFFRLIHAGTIRPSFYSELGSSEPIAWIEAPCEFLSPGYEHCTARYTALELRELLADAARHGIDLSTSESWNRLGAMRRYGHG